MDFDIKELRVIESDTYFSSANGQLQNIVYDCSGFNNNGIVNNNISIVNLSPKYTNAIYLMSGNKITSLSGFPLGTNPNFTVNLWLNSPSATFTQWADVIIFNGNKQIRLETSNTAGTTFTWFNYPLGTSGGISCAANISHDTWHMLTLTCDGTKFSSFCDGIFIASVNVSGTEWVPDGTISIGDSGMTIKLSDIKIYTIALSANQIKELFYNSMLIDSSNKIKPRDLE